MKNKNPIPPFKKWIIDLKMHSPDGKNGIGLKIEVENEDDLNCFFSKHFAKRLLLEIKDNLPKWLRN